MCGLHDYMAITKAQFRDDLKKSLKRKRPPTDPMSRLGHAEAWASVNGGQPDDYMEFSQKDLKAKLCSDARTPNNLLNTHCPDPHGNRVGQYPTPTQTNDIKVNGELYRVQNMGNRGRGLVARRDIKKGAVIGLMEGVHMTDSVFDQLANSETAQEYSVSYPTFRFGGRKQMQVTISPVFMPDGSLHKDTSPMFLINEPTAADDGTDKKKKKKKGGQKTDQANVVFIRAFLRVAKPNLSDNPLDDIFCVGVAVVACQGIQKNHELLVHYGSDYERKGYKVGNPCAIDSLNRSHNNQFLEGYVMQNDEMKRKPDEIMGVLLTSKPEEMLPTIHSEQEEGKFVFMNGAGESKNSRPMDPRTARQLAMHNPSPASSSSSESARTKK